MDWYPLRLSFRARLLVFGGRAIAGRLGKAALPDWPVAETWEVSDVDGYVAEICNGPLEGTSLRQLVADYPDDVMGSGWRGDRFPGGTPHSFGPGTLVYEIEQTSDIGQHAMQWNMEDGSPVTDEQWHANLDMLMREVKTGVRPGFTPGLTIEVADGVQRVFCCAGPYFALERWQAGTTAPLRHHFATAQILASVGVPVDVTVRGRTCRLDRAESLLLPAALGEVKITGPADVLFGYLPDLDRDIRQPLAAAGYGPQAISALGEGL